MLEKQDQTTMQPATQNQPSELPSLAPSSLRSVRNFLLSLFIPVNLGIKLGEMLSGPIEEKEVFRLFIQEVEEGLTIKVGSSNFIGKLMPLYIMETLRHRLKTGELLELGDQNEFDLIRAYNPSLDKETRDLHKQLVFKRFMGELGPHGLKFIQTLQAKESNGWIAKVITTAQSSLPAPSIEEFEIRLKKAFKARGSVYEERFSDFFRVKKILGSGTIGVAALVEFKSSDKITEEFVIKILHEGIIEAFKADHKCLTNSLEKLLATKQISETAAKSFQEYNDEMFKSEQAELNPNREMRFLSQTPYDREAVCTTVKANFNIGDQADGIVCMEKAKGIELGKYLQTLGNGLANAKNKEEKYPYLDEIASLRKRYGKLASLHFERALNNESLHSDLHPGNIFYDPQSKLLSILDLGSMIKPLDPKEHLKLHRFLFALNLSLGTADSHYLRLYYQNEIKENPALSMERIEPMLTSLQNTLDTLRFENADKNVMNVDAAVDRVMGVIKDSILNIGMDIVPSALSLMAKANTPVNDTLDSLRYILTSSSYTHAIPYDQRTQCVIALKASFQSGTMRKALWTQEVSDYFLHSIVHPKEGFAQLHFEKAFLHGLFGLSEQEAAAVDVLIPLTIISAAVAACLAAYYLKTLIKTVAVKIPEMIDSHKIMQQLLRSKEEGIQQMTRFLERHKNSGSYKPLFNWLSTYRNSSAQPSITTELSSNIKKTTLIPQPGSSKPLLAGRMTSRLRGPGFFAAGLTLGLATGVAATRAYDSWANNEGTATPSNNPSNSF